MTRIGRPVVLALTAALAALAACGAPATSSGPEVLPDEVYAAALDSQGISPTPERLAQGRSVCTLFADGRTPPEVATALVSEAGLAAEQVGYVITAAVRIFCPEHQPILDEFTASTGS